MKENGDIKGHGMEINIKKLTRADKQAYQDSLKEILAEAQSLHIEPGGLLDKKIRAGLKEISLGVKEETAEQYRALLNSKIKNNPNADLVSHLLQCGTKNSFDKTRSAIRFCIAEEIMKITKESDTARKNKNYELMKKKTIEAYEKYFLFEREFLSDSKIVWGDISHNRKPSASKKKTMNSVATIKNVFGNLKSKPDLMDRYGMILSISALTGCRPAEVQKEIEITLSDKLIHISISGAKVGEDRGQEVRKISFNINDYQNDEQMNYILSKFTNENKSLKYQCDKKDYNALRQYLYINHPGFSLYTLRHRVASQLKKEGLPEQEIAGFLGHRTVRSQENYGYARSASKGLSVAGVECSNDIKANQKRYGSRQQKAGVKAGTKLKNGL